MTITIGWWIIPLIIIGLGMIAAHNDNDGGFMSGVFGGLVLLICIIVAALMSAAFLIGKYF